jgi:hypothetical protein
MKTRSQFKIYLLFVLFIGIKGMELFAQSKTIFEHLTKEEGAKMTLEADITTIIQQKKSSQYFSGTLTAEDGTIYRIELKPRGRYRRKISEVPPLKMKFKKKDITGAGFDTLNEIKIVLPTMDSEKGDELLLKEYIAYRMYEHLTSASVKARLIRLTMKDTHVEKSKKTMLAMLLEDEEETCKRLNGTLVEDYGIPNDSLMTNQAAMAIMFQYMIGNTDWEIAMLRNVRLMRAKESRKVLVIPYDFDFSGFVSAPYASPSSESGLKNVKDRFLMANGLSPDALKKSVLILKSAQKSLYAICRSKFASHDTADEMLHYLDTFFSSLGDKDEVPQMMKMPTD